MNDNLSYFFPLIVLLMFLFATLYHVIFWFFFSCWNCKFEKVAEINKWNERKKKHFAEAYYIDDRFWFNYSDTFYHLESLCMKSFNSVNWIKEHSYIAWSNVSWEQEGHYCSSKMFRWEPEGRYLHKRCTVMAPFWFSTEHLWTAITPFWLSTDANDKAKLTLFEHKNLPKKLKHWINACTIVFK